MSEFSYHDYVKDQTFHDNYIAYQQKYRDQIRESDRVVVEIVGRLLKERYQGKKVSLLDIGCSTGNLLFHVKNAYPGLELFGGDFAASQIEACRKDSNLSGITFEVMDMLNIAARERYDMIISNAVLYMFNDEQYERAVRSVFAALKSPGHLFIFDFGHQFEQDLKITEYSKSHPDGLNINFRPFSKITRTLRAAGYASVDFRPFVIPIDLVRKENAGNATGGFEDLNSYTVRREDGRRMLFRGTLYQPWCHMVAVKP
ncbi:MAG: class I SAM-dependent methyltransferase [Planctomycetes bacterium]|nr:class I SAM-dependent methyltransferase [Planctomycetota bacterium]